MVPLVTSPSGRTGRSLEAMHLFLVAYCFYYLLVTTSTSKAPVTTSVALVTSI